MSNSRLISCDNGYNPEAAVKLLRLKQDALLYTADIMRSISVVGFVIQVNDILTVIPGQQT